MYGGGRGFGQPQRKPWLEDRLVAAAILFWDLVKAIWCTVYITSIPE